MVDKDNNEYIDFSEFLERIYSKIDFKHEL